MFGRTFLVVSLLPLHRLQKSPQSLIPQCLFVRKKNKLIEIKLVQVSRPLKIQVENPFTIFLIFKLLIVLSFTAFFSVFQ